MSLRAALVCLCVSCGAVEARAASSPTIELAPGVTAQLIVAGTRAGLVLKMPEGTKTYWRIAGETGLPTTLDFSGSTGLGDVAVDWPIPEIDTAGGFRNYVYHGEVVIPLRLGTAQAGAVLDANLTLGVCSDICIPAAAHLNLPLDGADDPASALMLDVAARNVPTAWDQPTPVVAGVEARETGIDLLAPDGRIDPASLIVDMDDPTLLFGAPQKSPVAGAWTVPLLGENGSGSLAGRTLKLTFMTPMGPYAAFVVVSSAR